MELDECIWRVYGASNREWVTQQARQMTWELQDRELPMRYLIRDHDTKFTVAFDTVFATEGMRLLTFPIVRPMPMPTPNAGSGRCGKNVWIA